MAEYISREDYCEENCGKENREGYNTCKNCCMLNIPTADVQPLRHGRWVPSEACITIDCQVCSECRSIISMDSFYYDYCPVCGAKMDGDT